MTQMPFRAEIAGVPGQTYTPNPFDAWRRYAANRQGIVPSTIMELRDGKDWADRPISQENDSDMEKLAGYAGHFLGNLIPAGQSELSRGLARGDPWQTMVFSALTGIRVGNQTDTTRMFKQLDEERQRLHTSDERWNQDRETDRRRNKEIDADIEALVSGAGPGVDRMTARQRTEKIEDLSTQRRTVRGALSSLLFEYQPEGPEKERIRAHINDLLQLDIVPGGDDAWADLDSKQMLELDPNALFQQAWERDPNEIARLTGQPRQLDELGVIGEA